jgi:hypothetical protein
MLAKLVDNSVVHRVFMDFFKCVCDQFLYRLLYQNVDFSSLFLSVVC